MKYLSLLILSAILLFASCTKDRDLTTSAPTNPNNGTSGNTPIISSAATASGTEGTVFAGYTITASNTPTSFTLTGNIPAGLSLNQTTGVLSGTPTTAGTYTDTVKATNASGTGTKVLVITIAAAAGNTTPVISSAASASGTVGTTFAGYTITASNTPTSFSITNIPAGLSLNQITGVISGTPTASGTFVDTIKATNISGTGKQVLTITIAPVATLQLLHYWNFNNDNPVATMLIPNTTIGGGALAMDFLTVSGTTGYYDSQASTAGGINAQNSDVDGKSLRIRNPVNDFIITAPTTGYKNIVVSYVVEASSADKAAIGNAVSYTTDGTNYTSAGISNSTYTIGAIDPAYELHTFNFSSISGANNNANFKIKITFSNGNTNTSGNDRFDNLTVTGYNQ